MIPFSAVVMAAGQGTRMRSRTPKVLHDLCGRPMVAWPVAAARQAGAEQVVVVRSPDVALEAALDGGVQTAVQELPDGTGGAVRAAMDLVGDGPLVVLSGDVPLVGAEAIRALVDAHVAGGAAATMATTRLRDPSGYGRVVRDTTGAVVRVVETKSPGDASPAELEIDEVNTGIFCFDATALREALPRLRADNAQGEYYLPEVLPLLREAGGAVLAHEVDDAALVLGVNDRVALAQVRELAQRRILEAHMLAGVTVEQPASTLVEVGVTIGPDTVLEPGTVLRGATAVGEGCRIGPQATVLDSVIGDGATVRHAYLDSATLEARVSVGPYAYLRPGTVLREGAKVGTFVEVKNSDVGAGTKVPHLSYLGDADVGEGSNIGAGTITANYDGFRKHRTTIGSGVRVSVDTSFVAPVQIGDGAWTAAGSVITDDVPPGALGVARSRQRNVEGYADRQRPGAAPAQEEESRTPQGQEEPHS